MANAMSGLAIGNSLSGVKAEKPSKEASTPSLMRTGSPMAKAAVPVHCTRMEEVLSQEQANDVTLPWLNRLTVAAVSSVSHGGERPLIKAWRVRDGLRVCVCLRQAKDL